MTAPISGSALKPIASARGVAKRTGQVFTIASMRASGFHAMRFAVCAPAILPIASIMPATVTVMPGRFTTRREPHAEGARSCAWIKASTTRRGESNHTPVSGPTGQSEARRPRASARVLEHIPNALEIDAHAEIEIGLRGARNDRGEMEHRSRVGRGCQRGKARIGNIARERFEPRILGKIGGKGLIDEREARDLLRRAVAISERATRKQGFGEPEADKAAASGDE